EFDYARSAYRVPASAAHAWVEVYFPDYGWVEFEPTAALNVFPYGEVAAPVVNVTAARPPSPQLPRSLSIWQWGLVLIIMSLLIGGVRWLWQWRLARRRTPRQMAVAVYWAARRVLGIVAGPSTTPNEFLVASVPSLENLPDVWLALRELTALYVRAAFSPHLISADEAHLAQARWR